MFLILSYCFAAELSSRQSKGQNCELAAYQVNVYANFPKVTVVFQKVCFPKIKVFTKYHH